MDDVKILPKIHDSITLPIAKMVAVNNVEPDLQEKLVIRKRV